MESNLEQQTPKLNVTNVSSAVFGKDGPALGEESKIGKLSRILRTTRIKVNNVEKVVGKQEELIASTEEKTDNNIKKTKINAEKITRLKNILQNQKSDVGEKLPGSTAEKEKAKLNTTLEETNRILVEIQKQLAYDFAMRMAEDKQEAEDEKEATSKRRFKREETALEKSARSVVNTVKSATKKIVSPLGNIFQKLLTFIGIIGKGIVANAAFEWFKDPENQKKITKFFNILKENWKLLRNIFLTVIGVGLAVKLAAAIGVIGSVLAMLANPIVLGVLAGALAGYGLYKAGREGVVGGPGFVEAHDLLDATLAGAGITNDGKNKENKNIPLTQSQQQTYNLVVEKRKQLYDLKDRQDREADEAGNKVGKGSPLGQGVYTNELAYEQARGVVLKKYSNLARELVGLPARAMGGPVTAGKTYLVGENGPELFSPNIDGSIVNNMRTEKIYQMLASGKRGRTRIVELPPQTIEGPKPEIKLPQGPATKAPKISSSNSLDGYRNVTSEIYGIMV